ncbi:patatin-like phospholipase family protein [Sphingomonas sp. CFBP9019]|uniref:patatin-like phospholipase family protein n=1 Tax=Sphingomonas sp. CFBP9019 TaxID=3096532 RepID=UPI002A6A918D|nr:patatin-like phospholipase family protein [Sphingomonas sp. CFBP9019]MDY1010230.1 patatin-like phospholipase family protein [Sphingomonas sp. CFBP9019]
MQNSDELSLETTAQPFRILSLDGGGAKGFYTLGVLRELEAHAGKPLHEVFDLIFGTSTGAIIASLLALGRSVDDVHSLYKNHVVKVMQHKSAAEKTAALKKLATDVYADTGFDAVKTGLGIVSTRWDLERPMIFKADAGQAHGRKATFVPGFGVKVGDAVIASCSAYPFFERAIVTTSNGDRVELADGGYSANNPTLYALADALNALRRPRASLRVVSVGVGIYPTPKPAFLSKMWFAGYLESVQLLQKTLEINTQSMDQLRQVLYHDVPTVRISETFEKPEMATDLFEHDLEKLNLLRQRGAESFAKSEAALTLLLA